MKIIGKSIARSAIVLRRNMALPVKLLLFFSMINAMTVPVKAVTQTNVTVAGVGTHDSYIFLKLDTPLVENCNYETLYTPLSSGFAEYIMSIALSARTARLPLTQINYTRSESGQCIIDLIIL